MTHFETDKLAARTYHSIPPCVRWLFYPSKYAYHLALRLIGKLRMEAWMMSGEKARLRFIFAGQKGNRKHIARLAFGETYEERPLGKAWVWSLFSKARAHDCPMLVLEVHRLLARVLGRKRSFFIPCWVGGGADISSYLKGSAKSDGWRIRKYNLDFEVTRVESQFDYFYNEMYRPYIKTAFGDGAFLMTYDEMKRNLEKCEMIFVKKNGEYICGNLIVYKNNIPRIWSFGVKKAEYLRMGIHGVAYYFAGRHFLKRGFTKMHYGLVRPFLKDGVLEYKKTRGMRITEHKNNGFLLMILNGSAEPRQFLINNPFIYLQNGELKGAFFTEMGQLRSPEDIKGVYKRHFVPGLTGFDIYLFGWEGEDIGALMPADLSNMVSISPANSLFREPQQ